MSNYTAMQGDQPGWVSYFQDQLKEDPSAKSYPIATYSSSENAPKVRYVVHRSLTPESSFLIFTTDIRMKKNPELASNPKVEAAFWMEKTGVQFRIGGKAAVLPNKADDKAETDKILNDVLGAQGEEGKSEWWLKKRDEEFENMSGHLRATFARPTPGTPLSQVDKKPEDWPESLKPPAKDEKTEQELKMANENYHLVAIAPTSFEMLELKAIPNRRTVWTKNEGGNEWSVVSVAP